MSPDKPFQPCLIFAGKAVAYLSGAPLEGTLLASPTYIRLGWEGLPGTKTLAYYKKSVNYDLKMFYSSGPLCLNYSTPHHFLYIC
jgi:hypothetical protein